MTVITKINHAARLCMCVFNGLNTMKKLTKNNERAACHRDVINKLNNVTLVKASLNISCLESS